MNPTPNQNGEESLSVYSDFLSSVKDPGQRDVFEELLRWVLAAFPELSPIVAWNQPMLTEHGSFIIGFSVAKHHFSVAPEKVTMAQFAEEIRRAGYDQTPVLFRIRWDQKINYPLLEKIIRFNLDEKKNVTSFWR